MKCLQVARFEVIGFKDGATSLYLAKRKGKELVYVGKPEPVLRIQWFWNWRD